MRKLFTLVALLVAGCNSADHQAGDAGLVADGASGAIDAVPTLPPVPTLDQALGCGTPATAGGLPAGTDLARHDVDLGVFPEARCNDGTGAVFYFRPYSGAGNRNRWVIQLQGGGSCRTPDDCAKRWCHVDTNFGMTQMTSSLAPRTGIRGDGILARRADNPMGGWNQVLIRYCSSDSWSGTAPDVLVPVADPAVSGHVVMARIDFLGSRILDAVLATLRRDGVGALSYGSVQMPGLDDAVQVLLAGASAGGGGTIRNADRVGALLAAHDTAGPPAYAALIDSSYPPSWDSLDFSTSTLCTGQGLCSWESLMKWERSSGGEALWKALGDDSCLTWHAAHAPDKSWRCVDDSYVVRNHVTTPMFIRMGQTDMLHLSNLIDANFSVPGGGVITSSSFAQLVRAQLAALVNLQQLANEAAAIPRLPGAYGPTCSKHETLSDDASTYDVTIHDATGDLTMFDVMGSWAANAGAAPQIVVTQPGGVDHCP